MIWLWWFAACGSVTVSPVRDPPPEPTAIAPAPPAPTRRDVVLARADVPPHLMDLVRDLQITPHRDGCGAIDGYRLVAVRRGSVPHRLGLRRGDVVHWVADRPVTSFAELLNLADRLTVEDPEAFVVGLTRRGRPVEIAIRIA